MDFRLIEKTDPEIARAISMEIDRQTHTLELIASENIASPAVMATQASVLPISMLRVILTNAITVGANLSMLQRNWR